MILDIIKFFFQDFTHWVGGLFYLAVIGASISNFRISSISNYRIFRRQK